MKKRVIIALSFILFLGLVGIFALRFLALSHNLPQSPAIISLQDNVPGLNKLTGNPDVNGQAAVVVDQTVFEAISKIPEYQIADNKVDQKQLISYLQDLGLNPLANKEFIEYSVAKNGAMQSKVRKADYKRIRVTFLPASLLPADYSSTQKFPLHSLMNEVVKGKIANAFFGGVANGDTFEISVYIDPEIATQFGLTPSEYLTSSFLKSFFYNFYDKEIPTFPSATNVYAEKTKNVSAPIFKITTPTTQAFFNSLLSLKNLIVPQAYAACSGARCGVLVGGYGYCTGVTTTSKTCSISGKDCTSVACGPYDGTCITVSTTTGAGDYCTGTCGAGKGTCGGYTPQTCQVSSPDEACVQSGSTCAVIGCGCGIGVCSAPTCTWPAYSACTNANTCGVAGTKTRTSSCGQVDTVTCPAVPCCGNGVCAGGETCSSCAGDCGVCTPPSGPYCGDNSCNNGENCGSCPHDCGSCPPSCTPSCTSACGQSDGCSGTCSNIDAGTPTTPTGLNPPNGYAVVPTNGQITLGWSPVAKADLYEVQVFPTGTAAGQECTVANHHCPAPAASNNYTFTADAGVTSYNWRVRAINTSCGSTLYSPWTTPITFTLGGGFSGTFFQDDTGICSTAEPLLNLPSTTMTATINGTPTTKTVSGTAYSFSNLNYDQNSILSLTAPAGYRCTCPAGCSYSGISVPAGNINFFLTQAPAGWWQTANGYVYSGAAAGPAITSQIPLTCANAATCVAAISMKDLAGTANSDSTSLSAGGAIDSTADVTTSYSYLNEGATNTHAEGMKLNGPREDYNYFSQLYGIGTGTTPDFTGAQPASSLTHGYYANGNVTINTTWTLNTTDSIVVFVNGDLRITQPIQVAQGAFLAFIVKGNIIFDKSLGSNTSSAPSVAGVYIANGSIITESNAPADELKFIGQGTFVGWGGVQLQRTFNNANVLKGNTQAIETFTFRPDFLVTVPEKMTKPLYLWQETN